MSGAKIDFGDSTKIQPACHPEHGEVSDERTLPRLKENELSGTRSVAPPRVVANKPHDACPPPRRLKLSKPSSPISSNASTATCPRSNRPTTTRPRCAPIFLDPFFRALGWDVGNTKGLIHTEREVDIEVRTATSGRQTRADYVFRIARVERFTCEAKKPAESLNDRHIYQAKRDAFNRGVPFALLSDFEELKIYIVGARPHRDEPHIGEFKLLNFRQYPLAARELWDQLGYDNVRAGSLDREIAKLPKRPLRLKGKQGYLIRPDRTRSLDVDFLNFLCIYKAENLKSGERTDVRAA